MEANGFVPKELQPLSPNMNGKPMHYNGIIHSNNMVPNGPLPVGAPNLNNNINPNNALQSSRDDLPWPKLIVSFDVTFISRLIIHLVTR
jgi:hypothetical protein